MAKKVLLVGINAKYIHTNLAIRSLQANAGKWRSQVEICEYTINHQREEIFQALYERQPDVIGFSCYLWNIEYVYALAEDVKKILPQVTILMGGPEVSYHPEEVLEEHSCVDVVMVGEGEKTFAEYLEYLEEDGREERLLEIAGLVYRSEGEFVRTEPRQGLDMNELVFPYEDLNGLENHILYYESIRGCPFSCSYCLSSIEKSVRIKNPEKTKKELDFFIRHKVPQVKFVDRTFNCNRAYAYEIWKYIGEHDNGVTNFHFEISGDLLREKDFELFATFRPGLIQLEIGVQSTNPDTIRAIRRTMNLDTLRESVARVHENHNIHQHLDLIAGLPYEDYKSFQTSFCDVYSMKPDQLQLGFLKVLTGSYMNEVKENYEIQFSSRPPYEVFCTKWLPYPDVLRLKLVEEMVEVYYNSFQFAAAMRFLEPFFETSFMMYQKLGEYYKEKGWLDCSHSRLARYENLWKFVEETLALDESEWNIFREALTFDLYRRDYVKNPPSFVRPRSDEEKRKIREYFEKQKKSGDVPGYEGATVRQLDHMLYITSFHFDMNLLLEQGKIKDTGEQFYLFDYKQRNPLEHSAKVIPIEL